MSLAAGAATVLPVSRLVAASNDSSPGVDLRAVRLSGSETTIERAAVQDLRASLQGTLLTPGDEGYETARHVWNGMIDRHPALIARCASTEDVVRAVTFARERELLLAVRAKVTARTTSSVLAQRAIKAGCRSIIPFQTWRAVS